MMFGIGVSELLVIFLVALLVLGPERLPAAARTLAKVFGEFRRATDDLKSSFVSITDVDEDWRKEHNNPRIIQAETSPSTNENANDVKISENPTVAREKEIANG